jgi:hypothetical protein
MAIDPSAAGKERPRPLSKIARASGGASCDES